MKTTNDAAEEYADVRLGLMSPHDALFITLGDIHEYEMDAFVAGVNFAEQWISVDDELPPEEKKCPRASIDCLVIDSSGRVFIAIYAFFLKEWWSNETQEKLLNIVKWRPITRQ